MKHPLRSRRLLIVCLLVSTLSAGLSAGDSGYPFVTNFSPSDYGAMPENWAIAQSDQGLMYFGNISGVLEYDGVSWRLIPVSNNSNVRSLDKDEDGRIWVGAVNDVGYLDHDEYGRTQFVSLTELLPEDERILDDVWNTHVHEGLIYFQSYQKMLRYDPGAHTFHIWRPKTSARFFPTRLVHDRLFLNEFSGRGLMEVVGDELIPIPGGDFFAAEYPRVLLPLDDGRIFVGTRDQGLFVLDEVGLEPLPTDSDELYNSTGMYKGVELSGDRFAVGGFSGGGVQVIDRQGRLLQQIDRDSGVPSTSHLYWNDRGLLWVARIDGISRIELDSPFEMFDERSGILGRVRTVYDQHGTLYAVGDPHVWVKPPDSGRFTPISGLYGQYWDVVEFQGMLMVAGIELNRIEEGTATSVLRTEGFVSRLYPSRMDPSLLYLGQSGRSPGLGVAQYNNGEWKNLGQVPGIEVWGYDISETTPGTVWVGTDATGVFRVVMPAPEENLDLAKAEVSHFGPAQGLPLGQVTTPEIDGETLVTVAGDHVYRFDETDQRFVRDTRFDAASYGRPWEWFRMKQDREGRVWIIVGAGVALARPVGDGQYEIEKGPLARFREDMFYDVAIGEDGYVWLYGENGLVRVDPDWESGSDKQSQTIIRGITAGDNLRLSGGSPGFEFPESGLSYSDNSIRFDFSLTSFREEQQNEFQTVLEGFDTSWSEWRSVPWREYDQLREGRYTFRVRGRDLEGREGTIDTFAFTIRPPIYRSRFAYVAYALTALILLEVGRRIVRRRAEAREQAKSRTERLELQAALLESENKRMEGELSIGHNIQMGMLTTEFPQLDTLEVNATLKPAREVGGDLYDVFFLDEDHLCCCVGDVSGKGVPAALFMAISKTLVKAISTYQLTDYSGRRGADADVANLHWSTAAIMNSVNRELSQDNEESMFVTAFLCVVNLRTGKVFYTNAGHNPPYLLRQEAEPVSLDARHGPILAAVEDIEYGEDSVILEPGEQLLIFTDGVTEAFNPTGELFTDGRLERLAAGLPLSDAKSTVDAVLAEVNAFEGGTEQADDITILTIQRK